MVAIDRFILLVRDLRRNESGMAIPTALMALIATFALASVAVISTVDVQRGTARDHDSKEAIAAADAGASIAMLRLNRYLPSLVTPGGPVCVSTTGLSQTPVNGWCPKTLPEKVGEAEYSYQMSSFGASKAINVVAWGTANGSTRRVNVGLQAIDGKNVFADEKVIGEEGIEFAGSSAEVETDLGTNGEITNSGNSHPTLCGNARHGIGKGDVPPLNCGGKETEGNMVLPPVVAPLDLATNNSNCRLYEKITSPCTAIDVYQGQGKGRRTATIPWNATPRVVEITNPGTSLTLSGENYFVCKLIVKNGKLYMPFNKNVNVYIDTPEHCGLAPGSIQFEVQNGEILSSANNPGQESYVIPNIYLLGESRVYVKGNGKGGFGSSEVMLYGPKATVEFDGGVFWNGMIAAKKVIIKGNGKVESSSKFKEPDQHLAPLFQRTRYVECSGTSTTTPNANC